MKNCFPSPNFFINFRFKLAHLKLSLALHDHYNLNDFDVVVVAFFNNQLCLGNNTCTSNFIYKFQSKLTPIQTGAPNDCFL